MLAIVLMFLVGMSQLTVPALPPSTPPQLPLNPPTLARVTAFSCSEDPRNPMGACHTFANGESAIGATGVAACPRRYMGGTVEIVGIGVFRCVDTMRDEVIDGLDHTDMYMGSDYGAHERARQWGNKVWEVRFTLPSND